MNSQPLRKKINIILTCVAFIAFFIISMVSAFLEYKQLRSEYSVTMRARINVVRDLVEETLFHTNPQVKSILGATPGLSMKELLARPGLFGSFNSHRDNFYILDSEKKIRVISPKYRQFIGLDFSLMIPESDLYGGHFNLFQSLLSKKSVISILYPLNDNHTLVVEHDLEHFDSVMASFKDGELYQSELLFILSKRGRTIYHPDRTLVETRHNFGLDMKNRTEPGKDGFFSFVYHGKKYVGLSEPLEKPDNWSVYYSIPFTAVTAAIGTAILRQLAILLLLFLLLFFTLSIVFNRFFSSPITNIVGALKQPYTDVNPPKFSPDLSASIQEFEAIIHAIESRDSQVANTAERFKSVLNSLDAVVYVVDMESYQVLFINKYGYQIWGDCTGGVCYLSLQRGQEAPCDFCTNSQLVDQKGYPTGVLVRESQNSVDQQWYECRDQAIRWSDGRMVRMTIAININERKRMEDALLAEKERLAVTLASIGDGVITTDTEGKVVFLNKVAEKLTGWSNEEAQGLDSINVFQIINERTEEKCTSPVLRVMKHGRIMGLANHTALVSRDGTIRSIADSGAPIRDKNSKIIGVVLVFRDVTHENRLEEELLKVRKLESIGVLAGGIAHDFNNILGAIIGNIELAENRIKNKEIEIGISVLGKAQIAVRRAEKLTRQLLTFSKGGDPILKTITLPELIRESADFVLSGSRVNCHYSIPNNLWMVNVDSGQVSQVIQNIIINANQAMPEGGSIEIGCSNVVDPGGEALLSVDKGDFVRITIQDRGVGIPNEIVDKIFDPYFTTKQEGSGLGLAICHSIINKHGGYLTVDSRPGKGSLFTIYLPAMRTSGEIKTRREPATMSKRAARIMIMDDDQMIRELVHDQLSTLGHETILVNDGEHAINKYQELQDRGNPVDVVIMDLTIPGGMGGLEAAGKLLDIDPKAKLVVASGYSNDPVMANHKTYGFCAAVSKPFDLSEISSAIEQALASQIA